MQISLCAKRLFFLFAEHVYKNVCGNVEGDYTRDRIDSQLKSELLTALQPAFAKISDMGIRYTSIPGHTMEVSDALNEVLSARWGERYGIEISTFGVSSIRASEEDEKAIKEKHVLSTTLQKVLVP